MKPVGIFDSGLGGLCALKEIHRLLPKLDLIYFGDTGRTPYGTRSPETIKKYAAQDAEFLLKKDVCAIVVACGTVSSVALSSLRETLPVPVIGVIEPAAKEAVKASKNKNIGVIGTGATIASGVFETTIKQMNPEIKVTSAACPLLIPIVEYGFADDEIAYLAVKKYIAPIIASGADTLILGCTHFPILYKHIAAAAQGVTLIDSGAAAARELYNSGICKDGEGSVHCFVSDTPTTFDDTARVFLGAETEFDVKRVILE